MQWIYRLFMLKRAEHGARNKRKQGKTGPPSLIFPVMAIIFVLLIVWFIAQRMTT